MLSINKISDEFPMMIGVVKNVFFTVVAILGKLNKNLYQKACLYYAKIIFV